jgi:5-(carboxyamino)imidazole ribonucleotide synthase
MLSMAAARLGFHVHVYDPDVGCPAAEVAQVATHATYDDEQALHAFAVSVDVVTYEFENIPPAALDLIEARAPIRPNRRALATSRDRLTEKTFLQGLGLGTAPFAAWRTRDLERRSAPSACPRSSRPARWATTARARPGSCPRRRRPPRPPCAAPRDPRRLRRLRPRSSVIAARGLDGSVAAFDPGENVHEGGILRTTTVPARIAPGLRSDAVLAARAHPQRARLCRASGRRVLRDPPGPPRQRDRPRVHNSGHWTEAGCLIDQFEQHIRAVAACRSATVPATPDVVMENLIGSTWTASRPAA